MKKFISNILFAFSLAAILNLQFGLAQSDTMAQPQMDRLDEIVLNHSVDFSVEKGDSLYKIAKKFGTTVDLLKRMNRLETDVIYPGTQLKVLRGEFSIQVDKSENILRLLLADRLRFNGSVNSVAFEVKAHPPGPEKVIQTVRRNHGAGFVPGGINK